MFTIMYTIGGRVFTIPYATGCNRGFHTTITAKCCVLKSRRFPILDLGQGSGTFTLKRANYKTFIMFEK